MDPQMPATPDTPLTVSTEPEQKHLLQTSLVLQKLFPIILVVGALLFGAFIYSIIQKFTIKPVEPDITTIIVSPTPSPTPFRYPTNVSTSSGFLALEERISSFSAELSQFSKDDPSLSPPNLVLPLGL